MPKVLPHDYLRSELERLKAAVEDLRKKLPTVKTEEVREAVQRAIEQGERAIADLAEVLGEEQPKTLADSDHSGYNGKEMVNAARVRISGGHGEGDPFVEALNESHYTMRSLAQKLGVSHTLLSQARTGKLSLSLALAKQIEQLTGFKASKKNWPKLRG